VGQASWLKSSRKGIGVYTPTHLQLLLLASILLLLMEPGAGEDGGFAKAPGSRDPAAWVLLIHLSPKLYLA